MYIRKKTLAWILSIAMILSLLPAAAFADGELPTLTTVTISGEMKTGETVTAAINGTEILDGAIYQWQYEQSDYDDWEMNYTYYPVDISGATSKDFKIPNSMKGKKIRVNVTYGGENMASEYGETIVESDKGIIQSELDKLFSDDNKTTILTNDKLDFKAEGENIGESKVAFTWSSDNTQIIGNDGTVNLPTDSNQTVTVTVEGTLNGTSVSKNIVFTVFNSENASILEELNIAKEELEKGYNPLLKPVFGTDTNIIDFINTKLGDKATGIDISIKNIEKDINDNSVLEDGTINYFWHEDFTSLPYTRYNRSDIVFTLAKNNLSVDTKVIKVDAYWDLTKLKAKLKTEVLDKVNKEAVEGENTDLDLTKVEDEFKLPTDIGDISGAKVAWKSGDDNIIGVKEGDLYNPTIAKPVVGATDRDGSLIANVVFTKCENDEAEEIAKMTTEIPLVVKAKSVEDLKTNMTNALNSIENSNITSLSGDAISFENVKDNIGLNTARKALPAPYNDGKYFEFSIESKDKDSLIFNGYSGIVYRGLPETSKKKIDYTITLTDKDTKTSVSKDFYIEIAPLDQDELNKEVELMEKVKASYFDGIRGENTDPDNITQDMHAFRQVSENTDGTLSWSYSVMDDRNTGIEAVPVEGYVSDMNADGYQEQWRLFKSSNPVVITNETLKYNKPKYDAELTITGNLSSIKYGKYAEKYPENETFKKLANQEVVVNLKAKGEDGTNTNPSTKHTVKFQLNGMDKATKKYEKWISGETLYVKDGTTAAAVFKEVMDKNGYTYEGFPSYISAITTPGNIRFAPEATESGGWSGWMYAINGNAPEVGMSQYYVENNDTLLFYFTRDYLTEYEGVVDEYVKRHSSKTTEIKDEIKEITNDENTNIIEETLDKNIEKNLGKGEKTQYNFSYKGTLPAKAQIALKLDENKFKDTSKVYIYKADIETGKLVKVIGSPFKVTDNKTALFNVESEGKYIISNEKADNASNKLGNLDFAKASKGKYAIRTRWNEEDTADGYIIYRSTSKKGKYKRIEKITDESIREYRDGNLKANTHYYYKVVGYVANREDGKTVYAKKATQAKRYTTKNK